MVIFEFYDPLRNEILNGLENILSLFLLCVCLKKKNWVDYSNNNNNNKILH